MTVAQCRGGAKRTPQNGVCMSWIVSLGRFSLVLRRKELWDGSRRITDWRSLFAIFYRPEA